MDKSSSRLQTSTFLEWFFSSLGSQDLTISKVLTVCSWELLNWGEAVKGLRAGPWKENLPCFHPWRKKGTNASLLPLSLPTAFIACRGWGGRGIPAAAGQYPGNCLLFPSPSPFYEGDNADIQWVPCASLGPPGPLTQGFRTVANPLPEVPPHPIQGASASPLPGWSRKKLHPLFSQGPWEKYV